MKRIVIWVKEEVKTKLKDEAHRQDKPMQEIVTKLIITNCKTDKEFAKSEVFDE